jgi:hypothetical protein
MTINAIRAALGKTIDCPVCGDPKCDRWNDCQDEIDELPNARALLYGEPGLDLTPGELARSHVAPKCSRGWGNRCPASKSPKCRCACGGQNHGRAGDVYGNSERHASFYVETDACDRIVIRDLGPWDEHPTVTNDAEWVVSQLVPLVGSRRLYYYDSEGELDELVIRGGRFAGFAPGPRTAEEPGRYAGEIARDYSITDAELERDLDAWADRLRREQETRGFVSHHTGCEHARAALALVLRRHHEGIVQ